MARSKPKLFRPGLIRSKPIGLSSDSNRPSPIRSNTIQDGPTGSKLTRFDPIRPGPNRLNPARSNAIRSDPSPPCARLEQGKRDPGVDPNEVGLSRHDSFRSKPTEPDLIKHDPRRSDTTQPQTDSCLPGATCPCPIQPDPGRADPLQPDLRPTPIGPMPIRSDPSRSNPDPAQSDLGRSSPR